MIKSILLVFFAFFSTIIVAQEPELIIPAANSNQLEALGISHNEKIIASGDLDGRIKIWEATSGKLLKTLQRSNIYSLAFTPDDLGLIITSFSVPEIYNIETGLSTKLGNQEYCEGLDVSPDGQLIAIGSESGITIWDAKTFKLKEQFKSGKGNAEVKFSHDSKMLALFGNSTIEIRSLDKHIYLPDLKGHLQRVIKIEFSKDDLRLLSASDDKTAKFWDVKTGKLITDFVGHQNTVWEAQFHPDKKSIITVSSDNTGKIWDKATGKVLQTLKGHPDWIYHVQVSPDEKTYAFSDAKGNCSVWNANTNTIDYSFKAGNETLFYLNYLKDSKHLIVGTYDPILTKWNIQTKQKELTYGTHNDRLTSMALSNDERYLLLTSRDGVARKIDVNTGKILFYQMVFNYQWATSADFSPDDSKIIVAGGGNSTILLNSEGGTEALIDDYSRSYESYSKFSPDGKYILHDDNFTVQLTRVSDNKRLLTIDSISMFTKQRFSPDGNYLITGGEQKVKIWPVANQRLVIEKKVATRFPQNIEMSHDSKYFLCFQDDEQFVEIWETATGKLVKKVDAINHASFVPKENKLFIVFQNGSAKTLNITDEQVLSTVTLQDFKVGIEYSVIKNRKMLISKSGDNFICWDLETGKLLRRIRGNEIVYGASGRYLHVLNDDMIEMYNLSNLEMTYRHYIIGEKDFLVQDNLGRYDGTDGARKILHFICGKEVIELEQAKDQLWVPNLAERTIKGEKINAKTIRDINICNLSPEVINIEKSPIEYSFRIMPRRGGLGETILMINGIEAKRYKVADLKKLAGYYELNVKKTELAPLFIQGKENLVTIKSYTADNSVSSRGLIVKETSSKQQGPPPNLYAVMIGVSDYKGNELDLKYAAKDATDVSSALSNAAKKLLNTDGKDHVFMYNLTTQSDRYQFPEKNTIKKVLIDIGTKATANDILLIFFAGHGIMTGENDKKQFYFLTADASTLSTTSAVKDVGISTTELVDWMKPQLIKAQKRILIFDACNSGQAINDIAGKELGVRNDDKAQQIKAIDKLNEKSGLFILSASASNQSAYEMGRYSQGLLTYSLLKAIKQQPDILEDDKYLNVSRWFSAAEKLVTELSKENGARQEPQVLTNTNFNIGIVDASVIAAISLPNELPLFAASNFQNSDESIADDDLELSKIVNLQLADLSARGGDKGIVYVTATNSPDAYTLSGRYNVSNNEIKLTVNLKQNKNIKSKFEVTGLKNDLIKLAALVTQKASSLVH